MRLVVTLDNWTGRTVGDWQIVDRSDSRVGLKGDGVLGGTFDPLTSSVPGVYHRRLRR